MQEHDDSHNENSSMSKRHMLIMALCCLLPMVVLIAVFALFPGSPYLNFFIVLLCPLSMFLMQLPRLLRRKKNTEEHNPQQKYTTKKNYKDFRKFENLQRNLLKKIYVTSITPHSPIIYSNIDCSSIENIEISRSSHRKIICMKIIRGPTIPIVRLFLFSLTDACTFRQPLKTCYEE